MCAKLLSVCGGCGGVRNAVFGRLLCERDLMVIFGARINVIDWKTLIFCEIPAVKLRAEHRS